jgi:eukaryotic-like serine/threonine-protein kinase
VSEAPDFEALVVLRRLLRGPLYDLYLARHTALDRLVLVKALGGQWVAASPAAESLEREARLLARLADDNIVRLFEFVARPHGIWLVLEHQPGASLAEVLERRPALDARAALAVTLGIAHGLAYLHARGVVHNDVRPDNVWLSEQGGVRLLSLTNADSKEAPRSVEDAENQSARLPPFYQSPEQLVGEPTTPASDVFVLGILLYQLLLGRLPWGERDVSVRQSIRHDPAPTLPEHVVGPFPGLERVVQRCLEKQPEQRFASADELRRALEGLLAQVPGSDTAASIRENVLKAGVLAEAPVAAARRAPASTPNGARRLARALGALVASAVVLAIGSLFFQGAAIPEAAQAGGSATRAPAAYGALQVVADPWAHVFVDGQFMETTPFAAPLLLAPGVHHVRLEHPQAPPVRRQIELAAGESTLLDVSLELSGRTRDGGAPLPAARAFADAGTR